MLHGCSSDIIWLQRDFGVYLVNVFDTGEAAKLLHYPSHGLAHLLHVFCGVTAQKQFQVSELCSRGPLFFFFFFASSHPTPTPPHTDTYTHPSILVVNGFCVHCSCCDVPPSPPPLPCCQLADWRVRPISPEMLKYAREDTHYLVRVLLCCTICLLV